MPHAYNRRAHGEQARRRARQACRACTPVWKACKACTPFGQACRLCTPVAHVSLSIREAYVSRGTLIRVPRYPYQPLESRGLREPAQVSSAGTDLGAGTKTRHQTHKPEPTHRTPTQRTHHRGPLLAQEKASSDPQAPHQAQQGWAFCWSKRGLKGPFLAQQKASSDPQPPHQAQKGPAKPHLG
ncbi:hypothetical protein PCANC_01616 [Puccinia coronata f. sp. avenae]|uniref:Uncharacterized protein n=1 Tax=Puccinia coronata f. sp. avenae TaxID=200324 RepID=A0A2N5W0I9_9BASI|nr:hypothetical protein PCANC_01616 [Puccinia coronata f. sp. avenae]